jgi:hypothetical protein
MDDLEAINKMTHAEMAKYFRFAPIGHPYFDPAGPFWKPFMHRYFDVFGGMTPEISELIGWDKNVYPEFREEEKK